MRRRAARDRLPRRHADGWRRSRSRASRRCTCAAPGCSPSSATTAAMRNVHESPKVMTFGRSMFLSVCSASDRGRVLLLRRRPGATWATASDQARRRAPRQRHGHRHHLDRVRRGGLRLFHRVLPSTGRVTSARTSCAQARFPNVLPRSSTNCYYIDDFYLWLVRHRAAGRSRSSAGSSRRSSSSCSAWSAGPDSGSPAGSGDMLAPACRQGKPDLLCVLSSWAGVTDRCLLHVACSIPGAINLDQLSPDHSCSPLGRRPRPAVLRDQGGREHKAHPQDREASSTTDSASSARSWMWLELRPPAARGGAASSTRSTSEWVPSRSVSVSGSVSDGIAIVMVMLTVVRDLGGRVSSRSSIKDRVKEHYILLIGAR